MGRFEGGTGTVKTLAGCERQDEDRSALRLRSREGLPLNDPGLQANDDPDAAVVPDGDPEVGSALLVTRFPEHNAQGFVRVPLGFLQARKLQPVRVPSELRAVVHVEEEERHPASTLARLACCDAPVNPGGRPPPLVRCPLDQQNTGSRSLEPEPEKAQGPSIQVFSRSPS